MIEGSCHCGAVHIAVARAPTKVTDCNCSICRRLGVLWAYCSPSEVTLTAAPEAMVVYSHGDRTIGFHHCRTCGCVSHWRSLGERPDDRMGVNARLLAPEILAAASVRKLDGASW